MLVGVLGASDNPARYAHIAAQRLRAAHHDVIGVNPRLPDLGEISVVKSVRELPTGVHTLTVYLAPDRSELLADDLLALPVKRVIFNPGSEHPELERRLTEQGTRVVEACTLVLLATGRFDEK